MHIIDGLGFEGFIGDMTKVIPNFKQDYEEFINNNEATHTYHEKNVDGSTSTFIFQKNLNNPKEVYYIEDAVSGKNPNDTIRIRIKIPYGIS